MSVWIVDVIGTWNWYFAFHAAPSDGKMAEYKEDGLSVDVKLPVKPVLSRELQLYFDKIVDITMNKSVSVLFQQALLSLATDSGLHPLVPYFTYFIADEVVLKIFHTSLYMCVAKNFWLLHQLMPSIITCLVAKRLGNKFTDNHWGLRNFAAKLVASICKRVSYWTFHTNLHNEELVSEASLVAITSLLEKRSSSNFEDRFKDEEKPLLEPEIKRHEAWCVYGALLRVAGLCMYDRLKMFPNKRKASTGTLMQQQPPAKKIATESAIGMMPINSMQTDLQGAVSGFSTTIGGSNIGVSSMSRPLSNDNMLGREVGAQAWKEDTDPGNLLASLFELFGESMLSFTPKPELSFFL
uniref:TAF6 C-terminal HEAT repeat domain-containing protein n=1 Tax=Gossypium raimondii TaxID=29730 RepID=A0A0D2V231_GOSRA|nr:hypothetical protein B456_009G444300 [Gossypium raimondii]